MKFCVGLLLCLVCLAGTSRAAQLNLATVTCVQYQNEVIAPPVAAAGTDAINTVMWLFGYSVGQSGAHVMYGDALAGFGFALDAECKNHPAENLLEALAKIKPDTKNPMDLAALECETFASRHLELVQSDRESAQTIMMWLFGWAIANSGSHIFDPGAVGNFETSLMADCQKFPGRSLADALTAVSSSRRKN